ncbi:IS3 family transposase ISSth1b [bioreactor metagenome]|uniref:IS3 family transposase ISSth1b n=1 Tax=bioreactor metagenome TaxID=1076179 RepID=A0A645A2J1_9ZZZZ|nr:helix-turn-helix domain-containing protein [Proteiniclasticum sp. QWL-01]UUM10604.1 helix-turn-helix domain containing protein [Clostridiaceae bacterium HFYG-1003]WFF71940.1 helix-turn-helix domain-containing protein [Proteiniclasticum sp. QWL-01]
MSYRSKRSPEEIIQILTDYLSGKLSMIDAANMAGVDKSTIRGWVSLYQQEGSLGLLNTGSQRSYTAALKLAAVKAYLSGKGSLRDICIEYKIRSERQLRDWIKVYNSGKDFNNRTRGSRMKSSRKTTQEERLKIVRECLELGRNYTEIAQKYQVSYQQVYGWVEKYIALGEAGLEDRRGKRTAQQEARTP